ncbi:MAG: 30S ribosomal protein S3 [Parcubacteria group bacterium CG10_big_fil_rev_8_21_14_0_10_38_31]|nr:MAG: 30S ribosomal protein S3 [Parcubacteria group bacterium CG10_big_fil_rev_8_21_14_0_10_38_31]
MSHSVHPYSFRLGIIRDWKSRWFNMKKYTTFLKEDVLIREWLEKKMRGMYVESIDIEREPNLFHIIIKTSRPGIVIGRKGEGIDNLKKDISKMLHKFKADDKGELKLTVEEVTSPESRAAIVAHMMIEGLEKRMSFRRLLKQTIEKVASNKDVEGVKIMLAGRLDGAEMSRTEWLKRGRIPLQTLRADIDFAREKAHMPYGDIGIKVWIYRGERFE